MPGLYLITPTTFDLAAFPARLEAALAAAPVDCLLIAPDPETMDVAAAARALVPIAQKHGCAALVPNDTRLVGRAKADGVHVDAGAEAVEDAVRALKPGGIVGVGDLRTRHAAMEAGERDVDYVLFGLLDRPEDDAVHPKTLELAAWWVPLFDAPCVVLAGATLPSVAEAAATGAEFVALRSVVWDHPDGPAAGIKAAAALLSAEPVA